MARIPLTSGFSLVPKGTHVFRIYGYQYDEEFGKLEIHMVTAKGHRHTERFGLLGKDGEPNEGAMNAFSFFAKTAMGDYFLDDIEPADLLNHYVKAEVEHEVLPHRTKPDKTVTFVRLGDKEPAAGFEEEAVPAALSLNMDSVKPAAKKPAQEAPAQTPAPATPAPKLDLDKLLG